MNVFDLIAAQAARQPSHPAVIEDGARTVTYAELVTNVRRRADALERAGVLPAWRVGMIVPQGIEFIETALAILAAGACMVPIADDHPPATIADIVRRAHLHALLSENPGENPGQVQISGDPSLSPVPRNPGQVQISENLYLSRISASLDAGVEGEFAATGPAYLRFTSGTTSERKGVVIGHARILERLEAANRGLGIGPADRVLWLLPMAHHFVVSILLYLRYGATILLPANSLAPSILGLAERERATVLYASPHHMRMLAKDATGARLDTLRLTISTAEGLRADVAAAFAARYGIAIAQALGIMEVGLPVMNTASAATKPDVLGRPQPAYDVWLRADDGSRARGDSAETSGEICIRGPGLLDAYLDPWTPARAIVEPDGFRTGDQGWFDSDGDLHLAGRRAARINMAGMKFFCEEVEAVLDTHPAIERSRVSARQHPHLGELPVAEIVLAPGAAAPEPRALALFCREHLAAYMVPRSFDVVPALELTPTGKLARR
ncbi:MAG: class I adenylate-forming enzyme family protein [Candidatus Binatia bacterium]